MNDTTTPRHRRPARPIRARVAAAAAAAAILGGGLSIGLIAAPAPTASAETPAERCARETNAYNQAWANSWAAANGKPAAQAPSPPVPYVCNNPTPPPETSTPTTEAPAIATPENGSAGGGPNVNVHGATDIPRPGDRPIVPVPGQDEPEQRGDNSRPDQTPPPGRTQAPATIQRGQGDPDQPIPANTGDNEGDDENTVAPAGSSDGDAAAEDESSVQAFGTSPGGAPELPLAFWLLTGAAAMTAASPRARRAVRGWSLLERGGDTRAEIGPTRLVLIHDETSDHTYTFDMNVPEGGWTEVNPDGSATVYDANGNPVSQVLPPWAFDAAGRPQKTWYTVDENGNLVQHVEPAENALYPILADPTEAAAKERAAAAADERLAKTQGPMIGEAERERAAASERHDERLANTQGPMIGQAERERAEATERVNQREQARSSSDSSGLAALLSPDGPGSNPPREPGPTQGAQPAPGQSLTYSDFINNNLGGEDVGTDQAPAQNSSDSSGLAALLSPDGPGSNPPREPGPTQGAQPAPGQSLTYSDFINNNLGGEDVGVINQRPSPDGTPEYFRTEQLPDGSTTEHIATGIDVDANGQHNYHFDDGTILNPNIGDGEGTSALTSFDNDGTSRTTFSTGEEIVVYPNGSGLHTSVNGRETPFLAGLTPEGEPTLVDPDTGQQLPADARQQILSHGSTALAAASSGLDAGARHLDNRPGMARERDFLDRTGKLANRAGWAGAALAGVIDWRNGEDWRNAGVGVAASGAGAAGGAFIGGVIGTAIFPGVGTAIGAGVGSLLGSYGAGAAWDAITPW